MLLQFVHVDCAEAHQVNNINKCLQGHLPSSPNCDQIHVVVFRFVAGNGQAWSYVGIQLKFLSKCQIQRSKALSNRSCHWCFQPNLVLLHKHAIDTGTMINR